MKLLGITIDNNLDFNSYIKVIAIKELSSLMVGKGVEKFLG